MLTFDQMLDKLSTAKTKAQFVLDEYPEEAHGSGWLEQAIGLIGRCEDEIAEAQEADR